MSIDLTQFNRIQKLVAEKQREADKAQGSFDATMQRIKDEYKCSTIEEAKAKLLELEERQNKLETEYNKELESFLSTHGDILK